MIRHGIINDNDRVELLDGYLLLKMPHDPHHDATVAKIQRRLNRLLSDDWIIRIKCAVTTKDSEMEPDVVVARGPEKAYDTRHPGPADVSLLVEVMTDSSLDVDREFKRPLYARAKIR